MGVPQVNHHAKSIECAECLEGKSENPLFHCLNAPCWMKIGCTFLIPPIFSPLPRDPDVLTAFFLHLRILQGLAAVCPNFGSIKTASATPVLAAPASPMLSWSKSLQPGHRGQSSCTDVVLLETKVLSTSPSASAPAAPLY